MVDSIRKYIINDNKWLTLTFNSDFDFKIKENVREYIAIQSNNKVICCRLILGDDLKFYIIKDLLNTIRSENINEILFSI